MIREYYLSEREGLVAAMKQLNHANIWSLARLSKSDYDEEILLDYFNKSFNDPTCSKMENFIDAATARAIYEKPYIPEWLKPKLSQRAKQQNRDNIFYAKIYYHTQVKGMGEREAIKLSEERQKIRTISFVDGISKKATNISLAGVARELLDLAGDFFDVVVPKPIKRIIGWLIPQEVRTAAQKGAKKMLDTAMENARNTAEYLGKRAVEVAQKAKPVIENIAKTASIVWKTTKQLGQTMWNKGTYFAKKVFGFWH